MNRKMIIRNKSLDSQYISLRKVVDEEDYYVLENIREYVPDDN